jgi:hypothetical protein
MYMGTLLKSQSDAVKNAIGRALKDRYAPMTKEALPKSFAALLACLESAERVIHLKARIEQLRRGLSSSGKKQPRG